MPNYDTGAIRNLLTEVFPDADEIEFFADDYFKEVKFEPDMPLKKRAHVLTQYCAQNNQLDKLLAFLQKNHPAKYAEHSALLTLDTPSIAPVTSPTSEPAVSQQPTRTPESALTTTPSPQVETPNGRPDVFISYRRKDLAFVTQLHQELTKRGISAWFDKENIEVADHWRTSIAQGIRGCKVFILVLSPDAVQSINIRKEVDLAETHQKKIIPLMWRQTEVPEAFEYALAGIQYIDFKETTSQENFNELADIVKNLLGGSSMAEATADKESAAAPLIPPISKEPAQPTSSGRIQFGKPKPTLDPMALRGRVISDVVTTFDLPLEQQDFINTELKWLFSAADHILKIGNGAINDPGQAVPVAIPPQAEIKEGPADNKLLDMNRSKSYASTTAKGIEQIFSQINRYLGTLKLHLEEEVNKGQAGKTDIWLQNQIKGQRLSVVDELKKLARLMSTAYGILVVSPEQLAEFLKEQ